MMTIRPAEPGDAEALCVTAPSVLFLDIDGVMNTVGGAACAGGRSLFTPASVRSLDRIVGESGCGVVVSSSWRVDAMEELEGALERHGLGLVLARIIGRTPVLHPSDLPTREDEIGCWLQESKFEGRLAILDDESSLGELSHWHVRIRDSEGLGEASAVRALELLAHGKTFLQGGATGR